MPTSFTKNSTSFSTSFTMLVRKPMSPRLHPETHKHVLVCNDGFHSHAHFMFAAFILWWDCYLKCLANLLEKEKVELTHERRIRSCLSSTS